MKLELKEEQVSKHGYKYNRYYNENCGYCGKKGKCYAIVDGIVIHGYICKRCKNKFKSLSTQASPKGSVANLPLSDSANASSKVCLMCNNKGEIEDLVNGKKMMVKCEKCDGKPSDN